MTSPAMVPENWKHVTRVANTRFHGLVFQAGFGNRNASRKNQKQNNELKTCQEVALFESKLHSVLIPTQWVLGKVLGKVSHGKTYNCRSTRQSKFEAGHWRNQRNLGEAMNVEGMTEVL